MIREIDGSSFYHLVTGEKDALFDLYKILPQVIYDCTSKNLNASDAKQLLKYFDNAFD